MTKGKSEVLSMILQTGMEVAQDYTVFNYGNPIPQKDLKPQGRTIVAQAVMKPASKLLFPGNTKEKI